MEPPLRSFVKSMTTKEGLKSLPDRLFVQKYLSAYTYPDIMEIIRSLFLNNFATLRIPLTLPSMSHHITSYLTVCSKTHSCCHQAFILLTLCEGVSHRNIPSDTNIWIEFC